MPWPLGWWENWCCRSVWEWGYTNRAGEAANGLCACQCACCGPPPSGASLGRSALPSCRDSAAQTKEPEKQSLSRWISQICLKLLRKWVETGCEEGKWNEKARDSETVVCAYLKEGENRRWRLSTKANFWRNTGEPFWNNRRMSSYFSKKMHASSNMPEQFTVNRNFIRASCGLSRRMGRRSERLEKRRETSIQWLFTSTQRMIPVFSCRILYPDGWG